MAYPTLSDLLRGLFGIDVWLPMPMFGLMVGIAFFVGLKLATREAVRLLPDQPGEIMSNGCLWAFLGGIVGARLFHILEYPREFLEQFPLDTLEMVGTLADRRASFGLVQTKDGLVHRVAVGNHMGQNFGRIVAISDSEIQLVEIISDGLGGYLERPAAIGLAD